MASEASLAQALSLLSASKNHPDLAVKISSLKQAKDILLSVEPSLAKDLLPSVLELQFSPEMLIRISLIELIEELGLKLMDRSLILVPVLRKLLKDEDSTVVKQAIVSSTNFFCRVLEEMTLQIRQSGRVEKWLEDLWQRMGELKDAVYAIASEPGSVGTRLLAIKFLETHVLLFTSDSNDSELGSPFKEVRGSADESLDRLLSLLQSTNTLCGSLIAVVINCLAAVARKRSLYYDSILSALLGFDPNFETLKGGHAASIKYALSTVFLGFLRCTDPIMTESRRDKLMEDLDTTNAGADDRVCQLVKEMRKDRNARPSKEGTPSTRIPVSGDSIKKRSKFLDNDGPTNTDDVASKWRRCNPDINSSQPAQLASNPVQNDVSINGVSPQVPLLDSVMTPAEQMIAMIGALLAEGERGAESLEILILQIHPDLMADIVITNMKNLPKNPPSLFAAAASSVPPLSLTSQPTLPLLSGNGISVSATDVTTPNLPAESRKDLRRDPRRLDPRRTSGSAGSQFTPKTTEDGGDLQSGSDGTIFSSRPLLSPIVTEVENTSVSLTPRNDMELSGSSVAPSSDKSTSKENIGGLDETKEKDPPQEVRVPSESTISHVSVVDQDPVASTSSDVATIESIDTSDMLESDQYSSAVPSTSTPEEVSQDLPILPLYIELSDERQESFGKLAVARIIEAHGKNQVTYYNDAWLALLSRLASQIYADDDIVEMLHKHMHFEDHHQKGHELAMHVLYYLHTILISESSEDSASVIYEKFLLAVAKSLQDSLPASDKSLSRLLGEAPLLPDSVLKLLEDLCHSKGFDNHGRDEHDGDRITQGLGAVWSLILGRPPYRKACLNIALKCAVDLQDEVRKQAIRLVANKLYLLSYVSESIEQFATDMLLSVVDQRVPQPEQTQANSNEHRTKGNIWKMPKLWVGFLKCASQTQPHSFRVLLKLPPAQLESALNKYASLRSPLAAHVSQPSIRTSLPRVLYDHTALRKHVSISSPHL